MRDILTRSIGCCLASAILVVFSFDGQVRAEQRTAPWDAVGCNAACRWWMNLGGRPAADIKPALSGPSPALSAKAMVPDAALAAAVSPTSGATVMKSLTPQGTADRTRNTRNASIALLPPERPAYIPGQSLWNVRISGSAPVLPATLLTSP